MTIAEAKARAGEFCLYQGLSLRAGWIRGLVDGTVGRGFEQNPYTKTSTGYGRAFNESWAAGWRFSHDRGFVN